MSPADFKNRFIKARNSETKEDLSVETATGEILGSALHWLPRYVIENK